MYLQVLKIKVLLQQYCYVTNILFYGIILMHFTVVADGGNFNHFILDQYWIWASKCSKHLASLQ